MEKIKKLWNFMTSPEMVSYIIFGVLTTAVNIVSFGLLRPVIRFNAYWDVIVVNTIAWILSVAFAFITNKLFVFKSKSFEKKLFMRELTTFVEARLFSLVVDTLGMTLLINVLNWNDWASKIIMTVIVIVINYILSKLVIFKK